MNKFSTSSSDDSENPVGYNNAIPNAVSITPDPSTVSPTHNGFYANSRREPMEMNGTGPKTKGTSHGNHIGVPETKAVKAFEAGESENLQPQKVATFKSLFKYPKGTYFCMGNEFSERFSFYGMKAILIIYLTTAHHLSDTTAKLVYHTFVFTAYFTPIFGSILSDGFFGRYRVILFVSIIYCVGHLMLTMSAIPQIGAEAMKALDYTGLFVIALATGGIKPCVSSFAADQFPESMAAERLQFFSFFYFMINLGALISNVITPIIRKQPCMGSDTCFPLAFGVPAVFMCLATIVFAAGTPFYKISKVRDNVIWRVCQCVGFAIKEKIRNKQPKKMHWLDYALPKYEKNLVEDVKAMFNVTILFIPVILFWALFEQQGSTWVLQANHMNGRLGQLTILPEQMNVLNPFLVILLIPLFEGLIYPFLARCNIWTQPLRRMGWGGFMAVVSFIVAGLVQLAVDKTAVVPPPNGQSRLMVTSYLKCDAQVISEADHSNFTVPAGAWKESDLIPNVSITVEGPGCGPRSNLGPELISIEPDTGHFIALFEQNSNSMLYEIQKTEEGRTRVYFLFEKRELDSAHNVSVTVEQDGNVHGSVTYGHDGGSKIDVEPGLLGSNVYEIHLKTCDHSQNCTSIKLRNFSAETGAAHVFVIPARNEITKNRLVEVIKPNSISIMWQVPQYVIITVGEILFSISGLAFSYTQASPKMKSVFQAIWLLTSSFGNLIDMGLSGSGAFEHKPALEFFVYGIIMGVVMILFVVLAWRYKPAKNDGEVD